MSAFKHRFAALLHAAICVHACAFLLACSAAPVDSTARVDGSHTNAAIGGSVSGMGGAVASDGFDNANAATSPQPTMSSGGPSKVFGGSMLGCKNLQCQQHMCTGTGTTISGRVYDPAGKNPIYNVAVYIPNTPVEAVKLGANCDSCDKLYTGKAVTSVLTDASGHFTLKDAPDGDNIPLVVQIGKWRKQLTIPHVEPCADTAFDERTITLPRNHREGDIPNIAISTGGADTLECLLHRVGVDDAEYVPGDTGDGRVHIFQGADASAPIMIPGLVNSGPAPNTSPAAPSSPKSLWDSTADLMKYDVVLLSCEGQETASMNQQALHDYASAGGRVFASHFHYSWFNSGPYNNENLATWTPGSNLMNNINATIVTSFPKGQALSVWLMFNNALVNGELPIMQARHNADVSNMNTPSQAWILADQSANPPNATQYLSFNTPTDAGMTPDGPGYCGRVVFSDLHVGGATNDDATKPVPTGCLSGELSPQEKALEFMLFDLSSCIVPDDRPPTPPPVLN